MPRKSDVPDWFLDPPPTPRCAICRHGYDRAELTKHHLVPKSRGGTETELICRPCHKQIHATFTEKELERDYPTVEALLAAEAFRPFVRWIRKRKPGKRIDVRTHGRKG